MLTWPKKRRMFFKGMSVTQINTAPEAARGEAEATADVQLV